MAKVRVTFIRLLNLGSVPTRMSRLIVMHLFDADSGWPARGDSRGLDLHLHGTTVARLLLSVGSTLVRDVTAEPQLVMDYSLLRDPCAEGG